MGFRMFSEWTCDAPRCRSVHTAKVGKVGGYPPTWFVGGKFVGKGRRIFYACSLSCLRNIHERNSGLDEFSTGRRYSSLTHQEGGGMWFPTIEEAEKEMEAGG